jgi:hypothetical protein
MDVAIVAPERCASFEASARAAAERLRHGVNLAVAAALATVHKGRCRTTDMLGSPRS